MKNKKRNGDAGSARPLNRHRKKKRKCCVDAHDEQEQQQPAEHVVLDAIGKSTATTNIDGGGAVMESSSISAAAAAADDNDNDSKPADYSRYRRGAADATVDHPPLVEHVSTFLNDWSCSSSSRAKRIASASSSRPLPLAASTSSIAYLVDFLKEGHGDDPSNDNHHNNKYNANVTKKDVASILLPWSISRLIAREMEENIEVESSSSQRQARVEGERDFNNEDEGDDDDDDMEDVDDGENYNDDAHDDDEYMHHLEWNALSNCLDVLDSTTVTEPLARTIKDDDDDDDDVTVVTVMGEGRNIIGYEEEEEEEEEEGTSLISSALSQSILNRLLPRTVRVALTPTTSLAASTNATFRSRRLRMADAAANIYIHLVQHGKYCRPTTLEMTCQTLLRLVDEYSMLHSHERKQPFQQVQLHQRRKHPRRQWMERSVRMRNATLSMVRMLVDTATNHKRLFATLSSTDVLPILGRWMNTEACGIITNDELQPQAATIVVDILQKGLYNVDVSMDGYRSAISRLDEEARASGKNSTAVEATAAIKKKTTTATSERDKWICFQSNLFISIQSLISPPSNEAPPAAPPSRQQKHYKVGGKEDDMIAMVGILPIITCGFFNRVLMSRHDNPLQQEQKQIQISSSEDGPSSVTIEGDAILQFRFWRHIISPVVDRLSFALANDDGTSFSLMQSNHQQKQCLRALVGAISETLGLVLKYDAYSPSYSDVDGEHFSFLERVTHCLLCCCSRRRPMRRNDAGHDYVDDDSIADALILTSLHCILSLNHRLLHERLADGVYFACSCLHLSSSSTSFSPLYPRTKKTKSTGQVANDVLSEIVRTYRELRQVGYFLTSTRGAFVSAANDTSRRGDNDQPLICNMIFMMRLGSCANIIEELILAYQTCPSGQISEIWNIFNDWILDNIDAYCQDVLECEDAKKVGKSGSVGESGKSTSNNSEHDNSITSVASPCTEEHEFAVQMFIVFIKNIRVSKQNSAELRGLCESTMSTSVPKLLLGTKNAASRRVDYDGGDPRILSDFERGELAGADHTVLTRLRHGFDLCGWLVDFHTRCCFWIDGEDAQSEGRETLFLLSPSHNGNDCSNDVLPCLRTVAKTVSSTQRFKLWKSSWRAKFWQSKAKGSSDGSSSSCFYPDEFYGIPPSLYGSLQRLALHRVHQLHSMIYYCNLRESELHTSEKNLQVENASSLALTNEARMLVDFSMYLACYRVDESSPESLWAPLAQSLHIWSRYSDAFHIEVFLIWFFEALCQRHYIDATTDQVFRLDKTIALTLARDASFYDVGDVMSLFMRVGMQFAISHFLDSIVTTGTFNKMKIIDINSGESTQMCLKLVGKEGTELAHDNHLDVVSATLAFLVSAPIKLSLCNENVKLLDGIVGLDILLSRVIKHGMDSPEQKSLQISNIIRSNMNIMSNLLPKSLLLSSDFEAPCLTQLTCHLFENCLDFRSDDDVVSASCNAISEYFTLCIEYYERNASFLVELFTHLGSLVHDVDVGFSPKTTFIRSVIRRMNILDRHHSLSKKTSPTTPSAYILCLQFVLDTQKVLQYIDFRFISEAGLGLENDTVAAKALLLESEVWSFIGSHIVATPDSVLITNDQVENALMSVGDLFRSISCARESSCSLVFTTAVNYFLSAMSVAPGFFLRCIPPTELLGKVLGASAQSFASGRESTCLDAALCSLIRAPGIEQTKTAIHHLLSKSKGCSNRVDSACITKAFHLLMTCANSLDQTKYLSDTCMEFLLISIRLVRDRQCAITELASHVKLFSKAVTTLISKKELLLLTGREISMICCEMNPILADTRLNKHGANDASVSIYISCCSVVESLISHYPKQLYGCPSPLFSLMLALLSNVLQTSIQSGASHKAQEYAK